MSEPILHVVLHEPEIPQNTGNIGRSCLAIGAKLWLVRPLGFQIDDATVRRAGLDYWPLVDWEVVDNWDELLKKLPNRRMWLLTKFATKLVWEAEFQRGDVLVFGRESKGLSPELREEHADRCIKLPMREHVRRLNLASTANTIMYEAVRQFGGLE